jgi:hypothetical protein
MNKQEELESVAVKKTESRIKNLGLRKPGKSKDRGA